MIALQTSWTVEIQQSWENDELVQHLLVKLMVRSSDLVGYTYQNGMLRYQGRLYIGVNGNVIKGRIDGARAPQLVPRRQDELGGFRWALE